MSEQKFTFQAEVAKLLDIVVHSLYSEKEIFLRELISNASDACDKLRYAAVTQPDLTGGDESFRITLKADDKAKTLTITDNGIGMSHEDLIENLGTIAKSGTAEFLSHLTGDKKADVNLIGQFGVGFYSAFMVATKVEVLTRKAGETAGWRWVSEGTGEFTIEEVADAARGAQITLHLREGQEEYLEAVRLRTIVKKYSDHIALPVVLLGEEEETLNSASALWTRNKAEVTEDQYKEFYHHVGHVFDEPWLTLHYRAEGAIEYTGLLYVPTEKPFNLFSPDRKVNVKLYVNRVFITDDCEGLLPPYLRFLRGVVDSADLPLNVSREMLQNNPVLAKMKKGLTKRILSEIATRTTEAEDYAKFWGNFGPVLKEGLYEDFDRREDLLNLCRFASTAGEGLVSFSDYIARMKDGQEAVYFITGDSAEAVANSPQLEGFRAKGIEVLLLTDPIDEFWTGAIHEVQGKPLKAAQQSGADLEAIAGEAEKKKKKPTKKAEEELGKLTEAMKEALGDTVSEVRASKTLTESPVCLLAMDGGMSLHLERMLRQHGQDAPSLPRVLEVNPDHKLIKGLAKQAASGGDVKEAAAVLLDQARLLEGETLPDPVGFAKRVTALMEQNLG